MTFLQRQNSREYVSPQKSQAKGGAAPPLSTGLRNVAFKPAQTLSPGSKAASAIKGGSGPLPNQCSCLPGRWQIPLFIWSALAIWWFGLRALESRWEFPRSPYPLTDELQRYASDEAYKGRSLMDAASKAGVPLYQPGDPLGVCIMTADFWGSPTAGGTATAYHLLAQVLASDPSLRVTFLGVTRKVTDCENGVALNKASGYNINFTCLAAKHFIPEIVETEPYEQLSHAVIAWVRENIDICDVIHGHEWGGLFLDLATLDNYRQLKPGLRFAIEAHGGHFWSTQGQVQRPLDITSLRIDHGERMTLELASSLISPTHYMTAFLAQRGWNLPHESIVIPNIIPAAEAASHAGDRKKIWRLAFFSRLEERKGVKLFVEAVNKLVSGHFPFDNRFEIFFVGAEAKIDMRDSSQWLEEHTKQWSFPVHIMVNVKRDEALEILSKDGVLLVLCSLIDNMPYVVAEAAVKGIPFLVFDVGGVLEMFDQDTNREAIVWEPTIEALYAKLHKTMVRQDLKTVSLSNSVTSGKEQWLAWHADFAQARIQKLQKDDTMLAAKAAGRQLGQLKVQQIANNTKSLELWNSICLPRSELDEAILLLPSAFELLQPEIANETMVELLQMGMLTQNKIGALTFGVEVQEGKAAFPKSPTWTAYSADETKCNDDVPVLIRKRVFCSAYLAEARIFRTYHSWILSMLLHQAGWHMHNYPEVMFRTLNYSTTGSICIPDRPPADRQLDFNSASNLYADAEEVMVALHLAPFPKPASSIVDDFPTEQNHKGWQIGYTAPDDPNLRLLTFWMPESGERRDGRWSCQPAENSYPAMQHSLLHPCAGGGASCCGSPTAPIVARFNSFFASEHAVLIMAYEVWPICGDGLDMEIALTSTGANGLFRHVFLRQGFEADQHESPQRQKVEFRFHIHVGDFVDLIIWPRGTHDCDGIYLVDMQIWENDGMRRYNEELHAEDQEDATLHEVSVGEITAGDSAAYAAAARGEGVVAHQNAKIDSGALEGAKAHQGETDKQTEHVFQVRRLMGARAGDSSSNLSSPRDLTTHVTNGTEALSDQSQRIVANRSESAGSQYTAGASAEERYRQWLSSFS